MVNSNNKNKGPFGIEGYNLPLCESRQTIIKYSVPKDKGKNFVDVMAGVTKAVPGPGAHDVKMEWVKKGPKAPKGGKKGTYIDEIVDYEKKYQWPSSHNVRPF